MNDALLEPFIQAPQRAGLFSDFDGTLSRIVEVPSDARPLQGVRETLTGLTQRFAVMSVVSGRSARELLQWLGAGIEIWGVHGAERVNGGRVVLSDRAEPYRVLMATVADEARRRVDRLPISGLLVEDKTVMVGLHFRAADDVERARLLLDGVAGDLASSYGLTRAGGRLAFELRPPETFSKEEVVLSRAREAALSAVMFLGDDRVDIPAFEALDELAAEGIATVRVAVASEEAPAELIERADLVVRGPEEALGLLRSLLNRVA